ncbi:MAG: hypothetical protein JJE15_11345 [Desulfobacteraceae bacterium]|nr:hypothetical protein [Desulfobacteraceae bacterium]
MKKYYIVILILALSFFLFSCAYYPPDRYNTQRGAAVGAGTGALIGQAIGGNTQGTLFGLAAGTIIGALVGNAADQDYQVARDAAHYGKPVIYYDKSGHAVEAIPEGTRDPNCQKVRKRIWEDGKLVKETVEEICGPPAPVVSDYPAPPPHPAYYYGWWGWPVVPGFSFNFGRPYRHGYYTHHAYPYHHGWYHR